MDSRHSIVKWFEKSAADFLGKDISPLLAGQITWTILQELLMG